MIRVVDKVSIVLLNLSNFDHKGLKMIRPRTLNGTCWKEIWKYKSNTASIKYDEISKIYHFLFKLINQKTFPQVAHQKASKREISPAWFLARILCVTLLNVTIFPPLKLTKLSLFGMKDLVLLCKRIRRRTKRKENNNCANVAGKDR